MSAVVLEYVDSREITNTSSTYHYKVMTCPDEGTALTAVLAVAPSTDRGLYRTGYTVTPEGAGLFDVKVTYGVISGDTGQQIVSVDIAGQTVHITHSYNTTAYAPTGATAPNYHGAIGVGKDGKEIAGTDMFVPVVSMTVTKIVSTGSQNAAMAASRSLTTKTNNAPFTVSGLTFDTHEVLYMGARVSQRDAATWEFAHSFLISDNQTGLTINDITVATKDGWQYLWVAPGQTDDVAANAIVTKPIGAYVEDLYQEDDFSALGLT